MYGKYTLFYEFPKNWGYLRACAVCTRPLGGEGLGNEASSEHDHSTKREVSYQPKLHQLMCYRVKQPSETLFPMNAGSRLLLLLQKEIVTVEPRTPWTTAACQE